MKKFFGVCFLIKLMKKKLKVVSINIEEISEYSSRIGCCFGVVKKTTACVVSFVNTL